MSRVVRRSCGRRAPLGVRVAAGFVAAAGALALAGCTVGGADPVEPTVEAAPRTSDAGPSERPTPSETVEGPSPQEISADLLAAAQQDPDPLGSVTAAVPPEDVQTTLDVLEVSRVDGATFVRLRLTAASGSYNVGPTTFASDRFGTQSFVRDMYLDDTAAGARYLPLQFEDHRPACVCPYKPLEIGPEPQVVHALFPALPDSTATVDLNLAGTDLTITGLPVG